jgi:chromosome segregation protein
VLVDDVEQGATEVSRSSSEGGRALVRDAAGGLLPSSPAPSGAMLLLNHVRFDPADRAVVERLLANVWIVDRIDRLPSEFAGVAVTREGLCYNGASGEVRRLPAGAAPERVLGDRSRRSQVEAELERVAHDLDAARSEAEAATGSVEDAELGVDALETSLRELRRMREQALEEARRAAWLVEQRRERGGGPDDGRRAELLAEISVERRLAERLEHERAERVGRRRRLAGAIEADSAALPAMERVATALALALEGSLTQRDAAQRELEAGEAIGERSAADLRRLAQAEYDLQARLRQASEVHTEEEVRAAQVRDREQLAADELAEIARRLGVEVPGEAELSTDDRAEREARLERLERRRERLGPVNPLAEQEYEDAVEHVEELERQRKDLEDALAELEALIRETDRLIRESFDETFAAASRNFEEVIQQLFPGGRGRLSLVRPQRPRAVLGDAEPEEEQAEPEADPGGEDSEQEPVEETPGVEIEVTPAGKSTRKLSLLSGGEKSLVALGFLFAVFLARPCPFYILDEVEAALDDVNIDRCMSLVRRFSDRSQFIIITHQRRTMEAADVLYGVSMAKDGISKVVSRRLEREEHGAAAGEELRAEERLPAVA